MTKREAVEYLLSAKDASGKTWDELAEGLGLCNAYVAQLFYLQARLYPDTEAKLVNLVPGIRDNVIAMMRRCPMRSYDPAIVQEPLIYRLTEVCTHYGEAIKDIVNEKFGDGIMSAIDFKLTVDKVKGAQGEDRIVITMNGKFLPHIEQKS